MKSTSVLVGFGRQQLSRILSLLLSLNVLAACATGPQLVDHSFGFDVRLDTPPVTLLDYAYGDQYRMTRAEPHFVKEGRIEQQRGVDGAMPRGEFLYVKWRLKATGEVFEDRVDLTKRLPPDIARHKIYFSIRERVLYVFLVSPNLRPKGSVEGPLRIYSHREVEQIYPGQPKY
jgi:hypothetical protein